MSVMSNFFELMREMYKLLPYIIRTLIPFVVAVFMFLALMKNARE